MQQQKPAISAGRVILSVLLGLGGGFATFILLIMVSFSVGLFGWSDGGEKAYLDRLELTSKIRVLVSLAAGVVACYLIIRSMNKPRNEENKDVSTRS